MTVLLGLGLYGLALLGAVALAGSTRRAEARARLVGGAQRDGRP